MKTRKTHLLLISIGMFVSSFVSQANIQGGRQLCDDGSILLYQKPEPVDNPRSEAPFTAWLDGTDVELYSADATYGTVGVYLFSTAGDLVSTCFDTATGSITIPISGLSGSYTIIITTSDGLVFEGQFVL